MKSTILSPEFLAQLWIPQGGDGTDDPGTGEETGAEDGDGGEGGEEEGDEDDESFTKESFKKLKADFDKMRGHLSNADRKKNAAEKELENVKRKERTDLENAQADVKKLTEETTTWQTRFNRLAMTNAFLIGSTQLDVHWHDPEVAQAAAKLAELEVGEDGTVEGMDQIIKDLAKKKPFLVKKAAEGEPSEEDKSKNGKVLSGSKVGTGSKGKSGSSTQLSQEELLRRFPALGR